MSGLTYGSFETVLHPYITPKITKLALANILLLSPLIDFQMDDREFQDSPDSVDDATASRARTGKRALPPRILEPYSKPDALRHIKNCFAANIVPRIQKGARKPLLREVLSLIQGDRGLAPETGAYFEQLSKKETLGNFLAEVYLCAVSQKVPVRRVSNLPPQNSFFLGREAQLEIIGERFQEGISVQGLYGMGGVGKTQLALRYAHDRLLDYETIWWISAETKADLQNSIAALLVAQKVLPEAGGADGICQAFQDYCSTHSRWLLIYDNAEYEDSEHYNTLKAYFPQDLSRGNVLLTTRCKNAFENAIQHEVAVFDSEEASLFLQLRSKCSGPGSAQLARRLGYLPLALEYAAAYIRETPGVDYTAYSRKLEQYSVKLLDRRVGHLSYKWTVRETFHITLDRLLADAAANPVAMGAVQFLNLCAYLAPDGIEVDVFADYGKCLPEPMRSVLENELDRDELIRDLTRYSLVRAGWGTLSIHRLLQEVLRDETGPESEMLCINYAYGVFYSIFYSLKSLPVKEAGPLLAASIPHVQAILSRYVQRCRESGGEIPDGIMVAKEYFSWTGFLLADTKQLDESEMEEACKREIPILEMAAGFYELIPCDQTIYPAFTRMLLAQANAQIGDGQAAFEQYMQALVIMDEAVDSLPADITPEQMEKLPGLYRTEAFQLASDICAAVGSSEIIYVYPRLLWRNFRSLTALLQKQMACFPRKAEAQNYAETGMTLWTVCCQVANMTQRAFILRLNAPGKWLNERGRAWMGGPHGFFFPEGDMSTGAMAAGFDILLEGDADNPPAVPNKVWTTLAFTKGIRTKEEMLDVLAKAGEASLGTPAKRALYGAVCSLAEHLQRTDIMTQYEQKLQVLLY